ncbi:unnamed protein product, partial [Linum tenue]
WFDPSPISSPEAECRSGSRSSAIGFDWTLFHHLSGPGSRCREAAQLGNFPTSSSGSSTRGDTLHVGRGGRGSRRRF